MRLMQGVAPEGPPVEASSRLLARCEQAACNPANEQRGGSLRMEFDPKQIPTSARAQDARVLGSGPGRSHTADTPCTDRPGRAKITPTATQYAAAPVAETTHLVTGSSTHEGNVPVALSKRHTSRWPSVSVVIPALNEARNLPHVFARLPADVHEVIVVDGHSVDDTMAVARQLRPDVRLVTQTRKGKGNALACGFAAATGDIIAMVDADGSADPGEIPQFVKALLNGAHFAKGTRYATGGGSSDITGLRSLGNRVLTGFFNLCYGTHYSDLCYGFNVFWRRCAPLLGLDATSPSPPDGHGQLWGDGFEVETLIHIRVAKAGLVVAEVPSYEHPRIHGVSNLKAFGDGRRVLRTIVKERGPVTDLPAEVPEATPHGAQEGTFAQMARDGSP
jgi:Glycosyl transferase family 2